MKLYLILAFQLILLSLAVPDFDDLLCPVDRYTFGAPEGRAILVPSIFSREDYFGKPLPENPS